MSDKALRRSTTRSSLTQLGHAKPIRMLQRGLLIATLVTILPLQGLSPPAEARGFLGRISKVIPFAGVVVGWHHRNRVYRSAERFIDDRNAYYDRLRETARKQLLNREIAGLQPSQTAAYVKLVALLEQHRKVELQVAEDRKRSARAEFHTRLEDASLYALAGSRLAQELVGAMQHGVGNAQQALDRVLNTLTSGGTSGLQDLRRIREMASRVSTAAGAIGGKPGRQLKNASDRIIQAIDQPQEKIQDAIEKVQAELANVNQTLDTLSRMGRAPSAGVVAEQLATRFLPGGGDSSDVSIDAITQILSQLEVGDGSLKDEARAAIREGFTARCAAIAESYKANLAALRTNAGSASGGAAGETACQAVKKGELTRRAQGDLSDLETFPDATQEPTKEVPPRVSAEGDFSEQYSGSAYPDPMGSSFTLVADFGVGTVTGSLSGGRTITNVPMECGTDEAVADTAYAEFRASYTAQFSASIDPESGDFSAAIAPAGSCSARYTQLYSVEGCTQFNSQPVPGCNPWSGQGTISGFVTKDGYIEFTTKWATGGGSSASGSWSGGGTVSTP